MKKTPIVILALIIGGLWLFWETAKLVMLPEPIDFDQKVLAALHQSDTSALPIGPPWLHSAVRDITALGSFAVLSLLTVLVSLYLALQRKLSLMLLCLTVPVGGAVVNSTLKHFFARERPDIEHLVYVTTKSFPSGHTTLSTVVYLSLAILLMQTTPKTRIKLLFLGSAVLLALLVGFSRVYLGVHYPTDVFAGWIAGSVWVMICYLVASYISDRIFET